MLPAPTTNTLKPSPSGTSAATGMTIARGCTAVEICPNIVSPMRRGRAVGGACALTGAEGYRSSGRDSRGIRRRDVEDDVQRAEVGYFDDRLVDIGCCSERRV